MTLTEVVRDLDPKDADSDNNGTPTATSTWTRRRAGDPGRA